MFLFVTVTVWMFQIKKTLIVIFSKIKFFYIFKIHRAVAWLIKSIIRFEIFWSKLWFELVEALASNWYFYINWEHNLHNSRRLNFQKDYLSIIFLPDFKKLIYPNTGLLRMFVAFFNWLNKYKPRQCKLVWGMRGLRW